MRELSHEIGRRQLQGAMSVILRQSDDSRTKVMEVGNAYTASVQTEVSAIHTKDSKVAFDGVIRFVPPKLPSTLCLIESKAANARSSISKLPAQLAEFSQKAYCVQGAWRDKLTNQKPLFLFVTNTHFQSPLMENGKLKEAELNSYLETKTRLSVDIEIVKLVCQHLRVFIYDDWLDAIVR